MATRTSSPPGSRSKSTSTKAASTSRSTGKSGSSTRSRSTSPKRKPAPKRRPASSSQAQAGRSAAGPARRPQRPGSDRAHSSARSGTASRRSGSAIAHALGAVARSIGHTARDLEPEHRRDGVGLLLLGGSVVVAAAVWWQLPGSVMDAARTVVDGSVGKVGFLIPLALLYVGWRTMRDPEHNGPAGRQVVGWAALSFGLLGIVQIADDNPQPALGDTADLRSAGGAVGYVVASLLLDLLRSPLVVVPLLALLAFFGVLIITGDAALPGARPSSPRPATGCSAGSRPTRRGPRRHPGDPGGPFEAPQGQPTRPARSTRRWATRRTTPRCSPTARSSAAPQGARDQRGGARHLRARPIAPEPVVPDPVEAEGRPRAAAAHPAAAARRAARAVRRHHLLAAGQRGPQARLGPQGALEGQRRGGRAAHPGAGGVRHRRPGHRLHPGPDGHPLRGRARPRGQGREGHRALEEHRVRRRLGRRADPQPDPRQVRDRHRDPEHRQGDRLPRRRAPVQHRPLRPPPDGGRARQGRRGRLRGRQPGEDAAPAGRRRHRLRQVDASSTR